MAGSVGKSGEPKGAVCEVTHRTTARARSDPELTFAGVRAPFSPSPPPHPPPTSRRLGITDHRGAGSTHRCHARRSTRALHLQGCFSSCRLRARRGGPPRGAAGREPSLCIVSSSCLPLGRSRRASALRRLHRLPPCVRASVSSTRARPRAGRTSSGASAAPRALRRPTCASSSARPRATA